MSVLTAEDLEAYLRQHDLRAELVRLTVKTPTVASAAEAAGTDERRIAKSLLFSTPDGFVLAIASGLDRIEPAVVAAHLGLPTDRIRLARPAEVLEVSGFPVGAMPPFGHRRPLTTLIDRALLGQPEVFAGGGSERALLRIATEELLEATGAYVLDLRQVPDTD